VECALDMSVFANLIHREICVNDQKKKRVRKGEGNPTKVEKFERALSKKDSSAKEPRL